MGNTLKDTIDAFPDAPGVYIMKDKKGSEIYIGKAVSIVKRVRSYFGSRRNMEAKTAILMEQVHDIDFVRTDSEVEALLLESRLIKDLKPKYNIELKWGERYPYLVVAETDDFPRVEITRDTVYADAEHKSSVLFIERFTGVSELRAGIHVLQKIFRFRTCRLSIEESDKKRNYARPCLLYHIHRCSGPCGARISKKEYRDDISRFIAFLTGKKQKVITEIEQAMKTASKQRRYEDAARLRDEMKLLEHIADDGGMLEYDPQSVPPIAPEENLDCLKKELGLETVPVRIEGIDISHTAGHQHAGSLVTFISGMPYNQGYRRFKIKSSGPDDASMIHEVVSRRISRLVREKRDLPDILLVDGGREQVKAAFSVVRKYDTGIRVLGLAKSDEIIYMPERDAPLRLPKTSPGLKLLRYVRDEAHRFARLYHTLLRKKEFETDAETGSSRSDTSINQGRRQD